MSECFDGVFIKHIVESASRTNLDSDLIGFKVPEGDINEL